MLRFICRYETNLNLNTLLYLHFDSWIKLSYMLILSSSSKNESDVIKMHARKMFSEQKCNRRWKENIICFLSKQCYIKHRNCQPKN